ncbi:MAG: CDP-alcohol phosphatidyltransferase family protein [Candidatus Methanoplasma sp.]|jgi:phosphatidylserine synthase|nr:CDP-alcohol phosphatidyltransferase family protein [Candidatus Methanoplasma sp.]
MGREKKEAIEEMRRICQPEKKIDTAPVIDRVFYRKLSFLFTRMLVKTNITPNQVTWLWGVMMMVSSLLFLFGNPVLTVIGAVGWIVGFTLDCTDGEIARYKKKTSKRGLFLDLVNHSLTFPALFICLGAGEYFSGANIGSNISEILSNIINGTYNIAGDLNSLFFGCLAGVTILLVMLVPEIYNSVQPEEGLLRGQSQAVEGKMFSNPNIYRLIRDYNPLTFMNLFFFLLGFAVLNLFYSLEWLPFQPDILWIQGWIPLFLFFYAVGYTVALAVRIVILYRRLK